MSDKVTNEEIVEDVKETAAFELKSEVEVKDGGMATITYDKDLFNNFIGAELTKAVASIGVKTDEYFKLVVEDSTAKSAKLYDDNEEIKVISVEAPIGNSEKNDKLEILHVRDEIASDDFEDINVKITSNISTPSVLKGAASLLKKKS